MSGLRARWGRRAAAAGLVLALITGLVLALISCRNADFDRTVRRALLCEECAAGERYSLVAYGDRAVRRLQREARGPHRADTVRLKEVLNSEWGDIRLRRAATSKATLSADSARMLRHSVDAFVTSYQKRALLALYLIGTPDARAAIRTEYQRDSSEAGTILRPGARRLADSLRHLP